MVQYGWVQQQTPAWSGVYFPIAYTTWGVAIGSQDVTNTNLAVNAPVITYTGPERFPTSMVITCYGQKAQMSWLTIGY